MIPTSPFAAPLAREARAPAPASAIERGVDDDAIALLVREGLDVEAAAVAARARAAGSLRGRVCEVHELYDGYEVLEVIDLPDASRD